MIRCISKFIFSNIKSELTFLRMFYLLCKRNDKLIQLLFYFSKFNSELNSYRVEVGIISTYVVITWFWFHLLFDRNIMKSIIHLFTYMIQYTKEFYHPNLLLLFLNTDCLTLVDRKLTKQIYP